MRRSRCSGGPGGRAGLRAGAVGVALAGLIGFGATAPAYAADEPAEDEAPAESASDERGSVRMARATWDTGWFQAEIYRALVQALGYTVESFTTMENNDFFIAAAEGEVDFWAHGWFPGHFTPMEDLGVADRIEPVGTSVGDGAFQGYLVDAASAEEGVTALSDLADPDVAARFDEDGDGRADLLGCEVGWSCGEIIDYHLDSLGLTDTVTHVQGDYTPEMDSLIGRYEQGDPVLFYTWTPNWTVGELVPGDDVRWLEVDESTEAGSPAGEGDYAVDGVSGCADPCRPGWPPNDIRVVANSEFLDAEPALARLFEEVRIPLGDIAAQNARMRGGEGSPEDIRGHAISWITEHEDEVTEWLLAADPELNVDLEALTAAAGPSSVGGTKGTLTVVTRGLDPFVQYEDGTYTGFSVELWNLVAERLGVDYQVIQVNSLAKQIDDVQRGAADVALGGLNITSARAADLALSQPTFDSGLQIMVKNESAGVGGALGQIVSSRLVSWIFWFAAIFGVILLIVGHIIWLFERDRNDDIPRSYLRGIPEAIWWAVVAITPFGAGNNTPRRNWARVFTVGWILTGYFLLAYFTASITSTMAVDEIRGEINGPEDLPGRPVAAVAETPGAEYLDDRGVAPVLYDTADEAYDALLAGEVDALVHDAPVLRHHAARFGGGEVQVVGLVFEEFNYGFGAAHDADLRDRIDVALLELVETGVYDTLYQQWFGESD